MKKLLKHLRSFFPSKLPIGMTGFNNWVNDIIFLSGLPNNEMIRKVVATFILRLDPSIGYISLRKVSNQLVKIAANQVAAEALKNAESTQASKEVV